MINKRELGRALQNSSLTIPQQIVVMGTFVMFEDIVKGKSVLKNEDSHRLIDEFKGSYSSKAFDEFEV